MSARSKRRKSTPKVRWPMPWSQKDGAAWWEAVKKHAHATVHFSGGVHMYVAETYDEVIEAAARGAIVELHVVAGQADQTRDLTLNSPAVRRGFPLVTMTVVAPLADE